MCRQTKRELSHLSREKDLKIAQLESEIRILRASYEVTGLKDEAIKSILLRGN
jgi:hypothetical protein